MASSSRTRSSSSCRTRRCSSLHRTRTRRRTSRATAIAPNRSTASPTARSRGGWGSWVWRSRRPTSSCRARSTPTRTSPRPSRHRPRRKHVLRRAHALRACAAAAVVVGVAAPPLRRHITRGKFGKRTAIVSALAWQAPVSLLLATRPSRPRAVAVYALQMWAYLAHYDMPDDDPEWIERRLKGRYPIVTDKLLGRGEIPTLRLQRALARNGVGRHDTLLSWLHWSWFLVPHGSVAYVLWKRPERYERAAGMMAATFDAGVATYWLVPTAPPWWAGQNGHLPPVRRIMVEAGSEFWGELWQRLYDSLGRNPFAAMPSLHFGTSVMAAHVLGQVGRKEAVAGWTYAAALGFALVYLGEHYVTDLVAGLALAEAVRFGAPHVAPAISAAADALRSLGPEAA